MKLKRFSVPKYEKNEDRWHIPPKKPDHGLIALPDGATEFFDEEKAVVLCDGASESYNSRLWASLLAEDFLCDELFSNVWLKKCIMEYEERINPESLSWSKQMAYERGSFSTFLSVQFRSGECLVRAVGDSCVFSVNENEIIDSYPYVLKDQFLEPPVLLSTKREVNPDLDSPDKKEKFFYSLNIKNATHVLLLTDAIAHWLMKRRDEPAAISRLLKMGTARSFQDFVEKERENDLRFDDTTMIRIELGRYFKTSAEAGGYLLPCFSRNLPVARGS